MIKKQEISLIFSKTHETLLKQLKSEEEWLRRGVKARLKRNEGRKQRVFYERRSKEKSKYNTKKQLELQRVTQKILIKTLVKPQNAF